MNQCEFLFNDPANAVCNPFRKAPFNTLLNAMTQVSGSVKAVRYQFAGVLVLEFTEAKFALVGQGNAFIYPGFGVQAGEGGQGLEAALLVFHCVKP